MTTRSPDSTAEWLLLDQLPPARRRILEALIEAYPKPVERSALASAVSTSGTSGSFANNLGGLRTLGLLDYPQPGWAATPLLFLPEAT